MRHEDSYLFGVTLIYFFFTLLIIYPTLIYCVAITMSSQYMLRERDRHKSLGNINTNTRDAEVNTEPVTDSEQLPEVPIINMEQFQQEDVGNKLDLLMSAINQINTTFHYKFSSLQEQLIDETEGVFPRLCELEDNFAEMSERIEQLEEQNAALAEDVEVLKGLIQGHDTKISHNSSKIVDLTARSMANNLVINGITGDSKEENCKTNVLTLFREKMGMEVHDNEIKVAHRVGPKSAELGDRSIVVRCTRPLRQRIFQFTKKLKDVKNDKGGYYSIRVQLPEPLLSEKKDREARLKEIRAANDLIPEEQKHKRSEAHIKGGVLYVDGKPQRKHVFPPTARQLLNIDSSTQQKLDSIKFAESVAIVDKHSSFQAHAVKAKSTAEVKLAYQRIKLLYPDADHIMMAYKVKSYSGHHHDGEYGAGPKLLKTLIDGAYSNTAVFVSRIFGGIKLGQRRFLHIEKVAKEALSKVDK